MTPDEFRNAVLGKQIDVDHFPPQNPYQCYDLFAYGNYLLDIPVNTLCAITGYVCDLWRLKEQYGYENYFLYIMPGEPLKNGDWCFWDMGSSHPYSHVAMYYNGRELGQNQGVPGKPYVTEENTTWDIMGALRPLSWGDYESGYAELYDAEKYGGQYQTTAPLNIRTGGAVSYHSLGIIPKYEKVMCWGFAHWDEVRKSTWLYVTWRNVTGFVCADYLMRV